MGGGGRQVPGLTDQLAWPTWQNPRPVSDLVSNKKMASLPEDQPPRLSSDSPPTHVHMCICTHMNIHSHSTLKTTTAHELQLYNTL